jgi:hypothetical protein
MEASAMTETRTEWTVEVVAARFAEAAETAHKLPRVRPGGYFNPWMTLAMQVPERYPDLDRLYRPMPPSPQAVDRMLETMRWVQWLEVEQRLRVAPDRQALCLRSQHRISALAPDHGVGGPSTQPGWCPVLTGWGWLRSNNSY